MNDLLTNIFRDRAADALSHGDTFKVDASAAGNSQSTLCDRTDINDDFAKHVFSNDYVQPFGITNHPKAYVAMALAETRTISR